jgi:hypothetical protein
MGTSKKMTIGQRKIRAASFLHLKTIIIHAPNRISESSFEFPWTIDRITPPLAPLFADAILLLAHI